MSEPISSYVRVAPSLFPGETGREFPLWSPSSSCRQQFPRVSHLRLRGGAGPLGLTYPYGVDVYTEGNCRCLMGCRCAHCWRRNQGAKIDRNIVPSFDIDNMLDAGDAPPDTLPSWPPPQGAGADIIQVHDPNSTALEYAIFGAPDAEEQKWLLDQKREDDDSSEWGPAAARLQPEMQVEEGHLRREKEKNPVLTAEVAQLTSPSSSMVRGAEQGNGEMMSDASVWNESSVPETRRVVLGAGIWTWETDNPEKTRIGNWYKISGRRALHIEGHSRWERRDSGEGVATDGGGGGGGGGEEEGVLREIRGDVAGVGSEVATGESAGRGGSGGGGECGGGSQAVGKRLGADLGEGDSAGAATAATALTVGEDWAKAAAKRGWVFCDTESGTSKREGGGEGRAKVLDTVLRGGWFLTAESAGSMLHVVCHKDRGGALIVVAGGNWSFVESRFRVRPGPLRAGRYPQADCWLGGHVIFADLRAIVKIRRCVVDMLPHRIRLASFGGIGAETYAKLLCVDTTIEGMLYGVLIADSASGVLDRCSVRNCRVAVALNGSATVHVKRSVIGPNLEGSFTCGYGSFKAALHVESCMLSTPHWHDTHMPGTVTGFGERDRSRPPGAGEALGDYQTNWPIHTNARAQKPAARGGRRRPVTRELKRPGQCQRVPDLPAALIDPRHAPTSLIEGVDDFNSASLQPSMFRTVALEHGSDWNMQALLEGAKPGLLCPELSSVFSVADLDEVDPPCLIPDMPGIGV